MVATPWRAFAAAARWKGQPPYSTTGVANASDSHSQPGKRLAGSHARTTSGTEAATAPTSRSRYGRPGSSSTGDGAGTRAW